MQCWVHAAVTSHDQCVNIKYDQHQPCKTVRNKIQVFQVLWDMTRLHGPKCSIITINILYSASIAAGSRYYLKGCIYLWRDLKTLDGASGVQIAMKTLDQAYLGVTVREQRGAFSSGLSSPGHPEHLTPLNFICVQIFWRRVTREGHCVWCALTIFMF